MTPSVLLAENPILPDSYDWAWTTLVIFITACMLAALVDVMRTPGATMLKAVEWVVLIVLVPVVGPVIWFVYGRNRFE